jgi:tryptophanyl-tRNA synthetase
MKAKIELNPFGKSEIKDYDKICKKLGVGKFEKFLPQLRNPPIFMKRGLVYGEKDFSKIAEAIKKKKRFALLTGLMPSGKFHIGHMALAQQIIYYQKLGAEIYIVVADVESYLTRGISFKQARETAIEEYILNYIALGLKPTKCKIYFQSDGGKEYNLLSKIVANKTTLNELKCVYGDLDTGKIMSIFTQVADILYPQMNKPIPTIVPVGFDQLPHINITRDITKKIGKYILPSATLQKFIPGLGGGKMSSSDPSSYVALTDTPKDITKKINGAFSGGQETLSEHRKKGGNPEVDVPFQYLKFLFEESDDQLKKLEKDYRSGKLLTGELKKYTITKINSFLKAHQTRRKKARSSFNKFFN